jgi:uncharacterized repeat protein (TIGR01451 family)
MAVKTSTLLRLGVLVVAAGSLLGFVSASPASATGTVGWAVRSFTDPTHFSPSDAEACSRGGCDQYQLVVRNVGDTTSVGTVTVTDKLPPGITTMGYPEPEGEGWTCTSAPGTVICTSEAPIAPEAYAPVVKIPVTAPSASTGTLKNEVSVAGGGAEAAAVTTEEVVISSERPRFELTDFSFNAIDTAGAASVEAGGHPFDVTAGFDVSDVFQSHEGGLLLDPVLPVENLRQVIVELPAGFVGDPQATVRCPEYDLVQNEGEGTSACPPASRIGVVAFDGEGNTRTTTEQNGTSAIYNMVPEAGYPAEFAFFYAGKTIAMYATLVHTGAGYRLRVTAPGIPAAVGIVGASLTFFGDPAALDSTGGAPTAFLTNSTDCSGGPLSTRIEIDSWENPGRWLSKESTTYPQLTGCDLLQFNPSIGLAPSASAEGGTTQADEPSGYDVDLKVPQTSLFEERATPELKDATVTLSEGVSVSPSDADGLAGCRETGPEGIDISHAVSGHEAGEGEAIGVDGLPHVTAGHCPAASTLGAVEVFTPLLPNRCGAEGQAVCNVGESPAPLQGHVYLAQPKCGGAGQPVCTEASATNGELFGLYIEVEDPTAGVIVKLPGTVSANPQTGQLMGSFKENPQLPFNDLKLHFHGGPRAPLANPQSCGSLATSSTLSSWAGQEVPGTSPSVNVDWDGHGGECPASLPFSPGFSAGTTTPTAGAFSPFTLTFSRQDREQDLSGLTVNMPEGLIGKIAGIPLCGEAQADAGTCSAASEVGESTATAGAGPEPFAVTGGKVYLTGPYNGGPFGLSIVVPAVAGPFNLGNVVVRASIRINASTAQVTVVSNPLPQIKDGVPFRLRTVNVNIDRDGFISNPTNCAEQSIGATLTGAQGASASVSSPFGVVGCATLPFKPDFSASTIGKTSKALGASLTVKIGYTGGQANLHKVDLELPKALPAQLKTLNKACTEAQFNSNPAGCPPASDVAQVTIHTPLLNNPLTGPAYLVSHGGAAFPDVEMVLQGEGVELVVDGKTQIKKGITYSHFEAIPDAPVSSFEFKSPQGELALFTANGDLCDQKLVMPTSMTGQNGAVLTQNTPVEVEGCSSSLSVVSSRVKRRTLTVSVYAPSTGKVTASGKGVSGGSKTYSGREALTFTLKQKKAGRLKTTIKLTYTPSKGKRQTKTLRAKFS